jgi:glycosyltransferase involved in cell wall biosynthesis
LFTASRSDHGRPFLSVVIPTRDRWRRLRKCLEHLARQESASSDYEVVVVDDGSTDGTAGGVEALRTGGGPRLRCLRKPQLGPAAARNAGIRGAEGEVVLFLGDDILATPSLVAAHAKYHRANPEPEAAALGRVSWSPEIPITPFMKWLEDGGPQFAYDSIREPDDVPPGHFYTANVSAKRAFMMKWGLFDESLRHAAFEDFDLGQRLARMGLKLVLIPDAEAHHLHPTTVGSACRRMKRLGEAAVFLRGKYPELVWVEDTEPLFQRLRRGILLSRLTLRLVRLAVAPFQYARWTPSGVYRLLLDAHYRRGVRDSLKASASGSE